MLCGQNDDGAETDGDQRINREGHEAREDHEVHALFVIEPSHVTASAS
jgi:hypothetical protein